MEFLLDDEHVGLAETIDGLASRLDAVAANRAWADGDTAPGLKLWSSLAELGITGLLVDDLGVDDLVVIGSRTLPRSRRAGRVRIARRGLVHTVAATATRRLLRRDEGGEADGQTDRA